MIRVLNESKHLSCQQVQVVEVDCLRVPYLCENGSNCAANVKVKSLCFLYTWVCLVSRDSGTESGKVKFNSCVLTQSRLVQSNDQ